MAPTESEKNGAKPDLERSARFAVAPMMDWTDRHCRFFHRLLTRHALLYTEMLTSAAIMRGDAESLLFFRKEEHPIAVQIGGSEPEELGEAARVASQFGYDEINFNAGCPSERVQDGCFGAVMMTRPEKTAECVRAMVESTGGTEVTVKCRIGVDEQDPYEVLPRFIEAVAAAGVSRVAIHARKALLAGLSPKENREIPPLNYEIVRQMKDSYPSLSICVNGGISTLEEAESFLREGMDGVMVGRSAYKSPGAMLQSVDHRIFGDKRRTDLREAVSAMIPYIEEHVALGGQIRHVTRHMLGLFSGRPGAKQWRRMLSDPAKFMVQGASCLEDIMDQIAL